MKYKLSRPKGKRGIQSILKREIERLKLRLPNASKKILKEMSEVSRTIEQEGLPEYLVCKKLPGPLGRGIFLHPNAKPILRGQVIASYAGELKIVPQNESEDSDFAFAPVTDMRLTKEEQTKFDPTRKFHPRRLYALDLDAAKMGNLTRYINHSDQPNVEARLLKIPSNEFGLSSAQAEIVYIAKKIIHPGEQLLVCYEDEEEGYWGVLGIEPFPMKPTTFRLKRNGGSRNDWQKRFKG